eukprot:504427-Prorocentrum_minimum.AAC.1
MHLAPPGVEATDSLQLRNKYRQNPKSRVTEAESAHYFILNGFAMTRTPPSSRSRTSSPSSPSIPR